MGSSLVPDDVDVSLADTCPVVTSDGRIVEPLTDCVVEPSPDSPLVLSVDLVVANAVAVVSLTDGSFVEVPEDGPVVPSPDCVVVLPAPVAVGVLLEGGVV